MISIFCEDCQRAKQQQNDDYVQLGRVRYSKVLCNECYRKRRARQVPEEGKQDLVADRVGADVFECSCGNVVPIHRSVRMMRKETGRIDRVCDLCSKGEPACSSNKKHSIVTPQHKDWNEEAWSFNPCPDELIRGVCSTCKLEMTYTGERWTRMTWPALAQAWEKV